MSACEVSTTTLPVYFKHESEKRNCERGVCQKMYVLCHLFQIRSIFSATRGIYQNENYHAPSTQIGAKEGRRMSTNQKLFVNILKHASFNGKYAQKNDTTT